ncbi:uncharacterized protein SOCEGT47_025690 [Sorangium cellulosum]|uniref:Uncharacterized protein n=2 Tax=Sorangium cellulosum TaxID=56 RepID=A0A4P2PZL5_SORCE|nr:uncharacterized protein SOCEGT47_025690 [Sorangium cellulosum]
MFAFFHGILGEQDAADASSELWEAVLKATADIVPGNTVQTINMSVKPYDGEWTVGEEKRFWIGSSEGAWLAFRTSGPVVVQRVAPDWRDDAPRSVLVQRPRASRAHHGQALARAAGPPGRAPSQRSIR